MSERVRIRVEDVEMYPVRAIGEVGASDQGMDVPAALIRSLRAAQAAAQAAEDAVMDYLSRAYFTHPYVAEWALDLANDAILVAVRDRWNAEHPDGPDWTQMADSTRRDLLAANGWRLLKPLDDPTPKVVEFGSGEPNDAPA